MAQSHQANESESTARAVPASCDRTDRASCVSDGPNESVYDDNGVDRSLIRSSLLRTPTECLEILEDMHRLAESVRRER